MPRKPQKIIDCDVHNTLSSHLDLMPYIDDSWKTRLKENGMGGLWCGTPVGVPRKYAVPPGGGQPASEDCNQMNRARGSMAPGGIIVGLG